jgi:uncharacterized protein YfiM (DUF2279 family)
MKGWIKIVIFAGLIVQSNIVRSQDVSSAASRQLLENCHACPAQARAESIFFLTSTALDIKNDSSRMTSFPRDSSPLVSRKMSHDPWLGKDKFDHALVSAGLVASQFYILHQELDLSRARSRHIAAGSTLLIGIAKEIYDKVSRRGSPSWKDLLADFTGAALAVVTMTQ